LHVDEDRNSAPLPSLVLTIMKKDLSPEIQQMFDTAVSLYKQDSINQAANLFEQILTIDNTHEASLHFLGTISLRKAQYDKAVVYLARAVAISPGNHDYHFQLATACLRIDKFEKAIEHLRQVVTLQPDFAPAHNNLATALISQNRFTEAEEHCKRAIELKPEYYGAITNLGKMYSDQGRLDDALSCYRSALRINPQFPEAFSNLLLALCYHDGVPPLQVFEEHRNWGKTFEPLAKGPHVIFNNNRSPDRILRIGYISPDFRNHSVSFFIEPVIACHDRAQYEIFCYSDARCEDTVTRRIREYDIRWRPIAALTDRAVAELVRNDAIDILVDLAGHMAYNRLLAFTYRPAPIQITYLGYPNTTGLSTMDYRLTDAESDPPSAENLYTEKLIPLENGFLCYRPPSDTPDVQPLPAIKNGYITFGSFNNLSKITNTTIAMWAAILKQVAASKLLIKSKQLADNGTRELLLSRFEHMGIERTRLDLRAFSAVSAQHMAMYNLVDIGLDTFPYSGTTTTCEALLMGVPVVTRAGETHAARVGASLLTRIGLKSMIAPDALSYQKLAVYLAENPERLSKLRMGLRNTLLSSPVCEAGGFTRILEKAYRAAWRNWVDKNR
jgi:protein O-GlcNAc transferase